jgi:hypothetical protein
MKMVKAAFLGWCGLMLLYGKGSQAYEVETHVHFSQQSAQCSVLQSRDLMSKLGLAGLNTEDPIWKKPIDSQEEKLNQSMDD